MPVVLYYVTAYYHQIIAKIVVRKLFFQIDENKFENKC